MFQFNVLQQVISGALGFNVSLGIISLEMAFLMKHFEAQIYVSLKIRIKTTGLEIQ